MSNDNDDKKSKFDIETYWTAIKGKWVKSETSSKITVSNPPTRFDSDLKRGQGGEHKFYNRFAASITHLDGRNADFEVNKTGETIELKTDYYDMQRTPNFFIERFSYDDKPGGPWQSLSKGITYYIYTFDKCGTIFVFNTAQLVRKLDKICKKLDLIDVPNSGYTTRGYRVERVLLESIMLDCEDIGLVKPKEKKKGYK